MLFVEQKCISLFNLFEECQSDFLLDLKAAWEKYFVYISQIDIFQPVTASAALLP